MEAKYQSPNAARLLLASMPSDDGDNADTADSLMGETDCPEGCVVEPDGICEHGYESAALTAGFI